MAFDPRYVRRLVPRAACVRDRTRTTATPSTCARPGRLNGADEPARAMRAVQGQSVYAYRFDWDELPAAPLGRPADEVIGAGTPSRSRSCSATSTSPAAQPDGRRRPASRQQLSRAMMSYWAEFAATGDPGPRPRRRPARCGSRGTSRARERTLPGPSTPRRVAASACRADAITSAKLVNRVLEDARFVDAADRCEFLANLQDWRPLPAADIARAGCAGEQVATRP